MRRSAVRICEGARLDGSNLQSTTFDGTNLDRASLVGADLRGAHLASATGLAADHLYCVQVDENTRLPTGFDAKALVSEFNSAHCKSMRQAIQSRTTLSDIP
jgi:uncharacterized protein YjbI with pentapeptide repeats